jgi:predicted nucleic acid-binding protein
MEAVAEYLADTSALARWARPEVAAVLEPLRRGRRLATCSAIDIELLRSARSPSELREMRLERAVHRLVPLDQAAFDRAEEVQALLAGRGHHRGVPLPDLLIAAAAESAGLPVLHYDGDYDLIAEVTGQPAEWVVSQGSVP